jgi:CRISPR-associated protein Cas5h
MPDYYEKLRNLRIGIEPLESDKGNFTKTIITYNNSVGYASKEEGGMLQVTEQTLWLPEKRETLEDGTERLVYPGFRCYLMLNMADQYQARLYENILTGQAEFLPYLGKNECSAWWNWTDEENSVQEYNCQCFLNEYDFQVTSIFIKERAVREEEAKSKFSFGNIQAGRFIYFERLPIGYDERLFQYAFADFAWTNLKLGKDSTVPDLFNLISPDGMSRIVQLFNYETVLPEIKNEKSE